MRPSDDRRPKSSGARVGQIETYPHAELTEQIIGGMYRVHRKLGAGFLEGVYKNALAVELRRRGLRVDRNVPYVIDYEGEIIGRYVADFVVESKIIVEAKAMRSIDTSHREQTINYLQSAKLEVGLILNFATRPQVKRLIRSRDRY